jgi:hypothetical protein
MLGGARIFHGGVFKAVLQHWEDRRRFALHGAKVGFKALIDHTIGYLCIGVNV